MVTVESTPAKAHNGRGKKEAIVKATYDAAGNVDMLNEQVVSPSTKANFLALSRDQIYLELLGYADTEGGKKPEQHATFARITPALTALRNEFGRTAFSNAVRPIVYETKEETEETALSRLREAISTPAPSPSRARATRATRTSTRRTVSQATATTGPRVATNNDADIGAANAGAAVAAGGGDGGGTAANNNGLNEDEVVVGAPTAAPVGDEATGEEVAADVGVGEGRRGGDDARNEDEEVRERTNNQAGEQTFSSMDELAGENNLLRQQLKEAREEAEVASRKNEQLQEEKKQSENQIVLLEVEKKALERENKNLSDINKNFSDIIGILSNNASTINAAIELTADARNAWEETKDVVEEIGEDVGNLRTDVDHVTTSHEELDEKVAAEIDRREEKESDVDDNMWKLSKEVEKNHEYVDATADNLRRDWEEENETSDKARNDAAVDYVYEEFAAKMDDHDVNVHKVENDLANLKDELQELKDRETGHAATGQATITRRRRVKVLPLLQTRKRNGASRQRCF